MRDKFRLGISRGFQGAEKKLGLNLGWELGGRFQAEKKLGINLGWELGGGFQGAAQEDSGTGWEIRKWDSKQAPSFGLEFGGFMGRFYRRVPDPRP